MAATPKAVKAAYDAAKNIKSKRTCCFTVGTSTAGWTSADCDYLCDGTADDVEINAAIAALPSTGGEVVILDGTYNITASIKVNKSYVTLRGNSKSSILKRMFNYVAGSNTLSEGTIQIIRSHCTIQNLQIDGNKSRYSNNSNAGIYSYGINSKITSNTCNNNGTGIYASSTNSKITGNTCNNNGTGIYVSSTNSTITGNTCIRGTGKTSDYSSSQYTIVLNGTTTNYNLIAYNNIMGKNYVNNSGSTNTFTGNKYN